VTSGSIMSVCASVMALAALGACSSENGIERNTQAYDGIAADETINLVGTEPFWAMEIAPGDGGYRALHSTPDTPDGQSFAVDRFAGNNGLGFSGELEGRAVQIAITPSECSDGMSDRAYPFSATLSVGDTTLLGCAYTDAQKFEGGEIS
jgi:uncharacterized membrane protein